MGCTTSVQTATYSQGTLKLSQDIETFCADQLLIEEVLFLRSKLLQVHEKLGLFKPGKHQQLEFVKPTIQVLQKLYSACQQEDINKKQSPNKKPLKNSTPQPQSLNKSQTFPQKYFQNLSVFFKNGSTQSFIPFCDFVKMYAVLTKLSPQSETYTQVMFSFLAKGQQFLPLSEFKHFLNAIGLDIQQLQNLYQSSHSKLSTRKSLKQQPSPRIFILPSLIQQKQFSKYLKLLQTSESHSKSLSAFQQTFFLLKNNKSIFSHYYQLKQLLIDQEINQTRSYGQQVFVISKKWYDSFIKLFHKIYDTRVLKIDKINSRSNFIRVNTNRLPRKDKKSYASSLQAKSQQIAESNLYALLRSQFIDNKDIQGEYQLELREEKNPQLSFKVLSEQLYQKIQEFLEMGEVKYRDSSKTQSNKKSLSSKEYRRKVLQKQQVEYHPVLIFIVQVNKKGQLNQQNTKQLLVSSSMTLKQLKSRQPQLKQQQTISFFVKYFEQKNFRQETNHSSKIKQLISKNTKLIIAITTNRVGFIQQNTRKQIIKQNITIGDKIYAYSEKHEEILPAYVLAIKNEPNLVKVHFVGKTWRDQVWVKTQSIYLQKQLFQDQKKRPQKYCQLYTGLINVGNTCYINSSLQSLLSTTLFSHLLSSQPMSTKLFSYQLQLIFQHLLQSPLLKQSQPSSPKQAIQIQFKRNMNDYFKQFTHWQQQDTQEFVHAVLDKVSQEQKLFIEKIFRFWVENELECCAKTCNGKKINRQAMTMITLPIPEPKQVYVQIILVPIYRDKLQKLFIKLHQQATLGQLLRKFEQRSGMQSQRVVMVEIDNGVLKRVREQLTQSLKDRDAVTLKQLGIVANYNLAAYQVIKQQKLHDLVKRNNRTNEKKQYYDFYIKQTKTWTIAKIPKPTSSTVSVQYLNKDFQITQTKIPQAEIQNKYYIIQSLGTKTLLTRQFHIKLFMRKLVQSPVNNGKIMENFGFPFIITLPIWCNYNDVLSIIYQQVENVLTKAQHNQHYTIRFLQPKRQKCIFCENQLSRVYMHNQDIIKRCCKVLQSDAPILFLASLKSFVIYLDWKNLNYYNSTFSSSLGMDRACKATQQQYKEHKVSLYECFNLLRIKQQVQMTCQTCKHAKMYRQQSISTLPPILIIQLKEYRFINQKQSMIKLNTNLLYDQIKQIDIYPYLAPSSILKESYNFSSVYELYSVIQHVGSGNSGHYTVISKRQMQGKDEEVWVFFDDGYSQIVDEDKVQDYMNNAYMLFYRKLYLGVDARLRVGIV